MTETEVHVTEVIEAFMEAGTLAGGVATSLLLNKETGGTSGVLLTAHDKHCLVFMADNDELLIGFCRWEEINHLIGAKE